MGRYLFLVLLAGLTSCGINNLGSRHNYLNLETVYIPVDTPKTCPGDTIVLMSTKKDVVADVLSITGKTVNFKKKHDSANVQHLKMKHIDTIRWDGYFQKSKSKIVEVDTSVMSEETVAKRFRGGRKWTLVGGGLTLFFTYSAIAQPIAAYFLEGEVKFTPLFWIYASIAPIMTVLALVNFIRWMSTKKAMKK